MSALNTLVSGPKQLLLLLLSAALVACAAPAELQPDAGPGEDNPVDAGEGPISIPDTPAGRQLTWVLAVLNGESVSNADIQERFSQDFLQEVPSSQVIQILKSLAHAAPWELRRFEGRVQQDSFTAVLTRGDGMWWRVIVETRAAEEDKMIGLLLDVAGDLDPSLASYEAVDAALQELASKANFLSATVTADACVPIHSLHPESSLALGSTFKLWVLDALAHSVESGEHTWSDTLPIQDQYKSLPSGVLQDERVGTEFTLRSYAEHMIGISDNTATDHLLFGLGRDAVEAALVATGHHEPTENQPLISTREMFILKLMLTPQERADFVAAPIAEKRQLLAEYDETRDPRTYKGSAWWNPIAIDQLEWFATPGDLCNVMRHLKASAKQSANKPVMDVLAVEPGFEDHTQAFSYIGHKGGSEPGVYNLTWLLQRKSDGAWVFLSLGLNDTKTTIDEDRAVYVAGAARALLAR